MVPKVDISLQSDLRRPVTSVGSRQRLRLATCRRPCRLLLCHTLWHLCIHCGGS